MKLKVFAVAVLVAASTLSFAQYGGGGTGSGGTAPSNPTYSPRSYGSKGAVIAGVGGGVAAAGLLYWHFHHKRATMVGCVGESGKTLLNEKDDQTYTITADNEINLKPDERVEVSGKRIGKDADHALKVDRLHKDFGSCKQEANLAR